MTLVLPEPERGAPMMTARAVMTLRPTRRCSRMRYDAADDDQGRRRRFLALDRGLDECASVAVSDAFVRRRCRHQHGDRRVRRQPAFHQQPWRSVPDRADAHIDDDRLAGFRKRLPVQIAGRCRAAWPVAQDDRARSCRAWWRECWRRRAPPKRRGHAGQHAERDGFRGQRHRLLAAAAEDKGVAALQPQTRWRLAGEVRSAAPVMSSCGDGGPAAALSDEDQLRGRRERTARRRTTSAS